MRFGLRSNAQSDPFASFAMIGIAFPMMIERLSFLVDQLFGTPAIVDRVADQIAVL